MKHTWLLQRLELPLPAREGSTVKPHHVFGGANLGLSPDAWEILDQICTVGYMGAAEFESGKIPKVLSRLFDAGKEANLSSFSFNLASNERALSWSRSFHSFTGPYKPAKTVHVFGLCCTSQLEAVKERVRYLLSVDCYNRHKRPANLCRGFDSVLNENLASYLHQPDGGWIDLDNDFMLFSDRTMWENFCSLLNTTPCEVLEIPVADYSKLSKPELVQVAVDLGVFKNKTAAAKPSKAALLQLLT